MRRSPAPTPAGAWTEKHDQPFATNTLSGKTCWSRCTGNHSAQTVTGSGLTDACAAVITQYRGAITAAIRSRVRRSSARTTPRATRRRRPSRPRSRGLGGAVRGELARSRGHGASLHVVPACCRRGPRFFQLAVLTHPLLTPVWRWRRRARRAPSRGRRPMRSAPRGPMRSCRRPLCRRSSHRS